VTAAVSTIERRTLAKVSWRLLPLIALAYCIAYIDRTNVGFAALTMNKDLGLSAYIYGWGAGIFFFGYFLFEVPSNLILEKIGARIWIARIMLTWGIISALSAFVTGPTSFLVIRFLLGVAEAGFFPGMILYFTYWYPAEYRGRVISTLFIAQPVANALASIVSGAVLGMDGILGLKGWQWVFIIEALPAIALAFVVWFVMTDRPSVAEWLEAEESDWLTARLEEERRTIDRHHGVMSLFESLRDPRVLALSAIYFCGVTANYGIVFFMPQIVKGMRLSNLMTGFAASVPYIIGTIGLIVVRPPPGAPLAPHHRLVARGRRARRRRLARLIVLGADGHVGGDHRYLRLARGVLADAVAVPHRHRGGRGDRAHQRDRQSRRLCRAIRGGLDQGQHRQLRGRPLFPGRLGVRCGRHHVLRDRSVGRRAATHARRGAGFTMSAVR
jgi:MFS family permease